MDALGQSNCQTTGERKDRLMGSEMNVCKPWFTGGFLTTPVTDIFPPYFLKICFSVKLVVYTDFTLDTSDYPDWMKALIKTGFRFLRLNQYYLSCESFFLNKLDFIFFFLLSSEFFSTNWTMSALQSQRFSSLATFTVVLPTHSVNR